MIVVMPRVVKKTVDKLKRWPDGATVTGIWRGGKTKNKEDRVLLKKGKTPATKDLVINTFSK